MSGSASLGVEQAMLSHTLGIGPVAAVSRAYVALCLASLVPDERTAGREVSGNGYARLAASFQVLASPPNMAANTTTVAFPIATAPWGVLGYFELWDAPYGGNRLYWGALVDPADGTTPITLSVSAGDVLRFSAGALGVRIGPSGSSTVGGAFLPLVGGTLASPGNLTVGGWLTVTGAAATLGGPLSVTGPTALAGGATITGDSAIRSGYFTLALDPTSPMHAATKQYVDGGGAGGGGGPFLPTTGGSLNGPGNLGVGGTLGVTGNATFGGTHAVTGVSTATGGFNGNTVFGIAGGGVGVGLTVNNTATVARLNVTGSTHVWTPSTVADATSQAIISGGQSVTGTMGAVDGSVWLFGLSGNSIDNSAAPDPFMPFKINTNFGGTKGSIGAASISQQQTSDLLDPDGVTRFYTALQVTQGLSHKAGNASNAVGFNVAVNQANGATGWSNLEAVELGIQRTAGTTIANSNILGLISTNSSGNHATSTESYLHLLAGGGTTSLITGILLGAPNAQWPIDPTNGWVIDTIQQVNNNPGNAQRMAQAAAGGFDFSQVNFSDSVMKSPGVRIKGIPEIDIGPASIAASATGAQIDVVGYKGALGAVIANGSGYQVNDQLYDGCGGIISVDTISGPGGVLTAHYLVGKEPYWYGTGAPATVATAGGSGNGAATFNVTWTQQTTLSLQPSGGATQVSGALNHYNTGNAHYNITSGNANSHTDPWQTSFVWLSSVAPLTAASVAHSYWVNDIVQSSGQLIGFAITHNIAPNGNSASGVRTGLNVSVTQVGTSQGGSFTSTGFTSGAVINCWGNSNVGGTATLYNGNLNALNPTMRILGGATFMTNGSGIETNTSAETGSSYGSFIQHSNVLFSTHRVHGYLNENISYGAAAQITALPDIMYGLRFNDQDAGNMFSPRAKVVSVSTDTSRNPVTVASNLDFGNTIVGAFHERGPYSAVVPLQAIGITGATRLTSDGLTASSFIYEAFVTNRGTGFTTFPTITVTGGVGAQINAMLGSGGVMGKPGVFTAGTGVPPEATAAVTGGGGSGATVALVMAGNTLNFGINSAVHCEARIVMRSTTGEAICWSCEFGARMGATASTTAIIGSPAWTQAWATAGAPAAISISAPAADTTLGAINITVTPSSLTWSGGGQVRMTKSSRV